MALRPHPGYKQFSYCFNHARDELRQLMKRWDNRLTLKRLSWAELYLKGRICIVLYVSFGTGRETLDYSVRSDARVIANGNDISVLVFSVNCENDDPENNDQEAMFIRNVQIVQSVQGIIPSTVRFYRINNEVIDVRSRSLYFSTFSLTYKFLPLFKEWEFAGPISNDLVHHQIEGRMKVVDGISNNQGNAIWERVDPLERENIVSSICIFLDTKTAKISLKPIKKGIEISDVLIGPFDL